ncbi:MAG TPA: glycosyltransferase family 2 protein [Bryobacterales bacterium]|nr:glycosyltransferase family 2 protein [Bryobacterales bacterium]
MVYNGERFLARAIESLTKQTLRDFELVIADDASADGSDEICRAYAATDPRIRYIRHPRNIGMYANFDFVVREARGEYFMWAAQDDEWDPEWCEVLLENMTPGTIISFGHVRLTGPGGRVLQRYHFPHYSRNPVRRTFQLFFQDMPWSIGSSPIYGICRRAEMLRFPICETEKISRDSADSLWVFVMGQRGYISTDDRVYHHKRAGYRRGPRPPWATVLAEQVLVLHQVRMLTCFPRLVRRRWLRPIFALLVPVRYALRLCVSNTALVRKLAARIRRRAPLLREHWQ